MIDEREERRGEERREEKKRGYCNNDRCSQPFSSSNLRTRVGRMRSCSALQHLQVVVDVIVVIASIGLDQGSRLEVRTISNFVQVSDGAIQRLEAYVRVEARYELGDTRKDGMELLAGFEFHAK
ncbi:hypothetical protein SCHPADRAFT_340630 [Schizopora paradoxa]|uniref:Uncharacterized protein n=1 Tax=Schizopora paradoxa TaxID=27342 RepID=A0A0H2RQJ6_9AGAM|nr:hypothetical protein SCHPADRAFT_340630 [Schizopora paradoxa]